MQIQDCHLQMMALWTACLWGMLFHLALMLLLGAGGGHIHDDLPRTTMFGVIWGELGWVMAALIVTTSGRTQRYKTLHFAWIWPYAVIQGSNRRLSEVDRGLLSGVEPQSVLRVDH